MGVWFVAGSRPTTNSAHVGACASAGSRDLAPRQHFGPKRAISPLRARGRSPAPTQRPWFVASSRTQTNSAAHGPRRPPESRDLEPTSAADAPRGRAGPPRSPRVPPERAAAVRARGAMRAIGSGGRARRGVRFGARGQAREHEEELHSGKGSSGSCPDSDLHPVGTRAAHPVPALRGCARRAAPLIGSPIYGGVGGGTSSDRIAGAVPGATNAVAICSCRFRVSNWCRTPSASRSMITADGIRSQISRLEPPRRPPR